MKNQQQYTQDCLRTWKAPNTRSLFNNESLAYLGLTIAQRDEVMDEIKDLVSQAAGYEELAHIIAGFSSEILSELEFAFALRDQVNIKEEIGDLQYYILIAARKYSIDLTSIDETSTTTYSDNKIAKFCLDSPFKAVKYHAGEFINLLKKMYIYQSAKVLHEDLASTLQALQAAIYRLSMKNGFTPEGAIESVIAKLKVRYAEKFSVTEADDRNLDGEREALS